MTSAGKTKDIDPELPGQELHTILDPLPAVLEALTRDRIIAAQERAADAAIDAVIDANLGRINQKPASNAGHGGSPTSGQ